MLKISYKKFQKYISNFVIIITIVLLSILTYQGGVLGVFSNKNTEPIYCGNPNNNSVSLMFNVYMGNEYVEQIIEVLQQNNIKATFFVGGIWVEKNEECFMKIYNSGNELGNHGYWHKDHNKLSDEEQINEIMLTDNLVNRITGVKMTLFAPPSGAFNKNTVNIAETLNYKTIMWSKDTIDWRDQDTRVIISRATKNIQAGDMILMHPTKATAESLKEIINIIKSKNLNVTSVSENIKK